jgi:hypothetical protein
VLKPTDLIARYGLRYLGSDQSHAPQVKVRNKVDLSTISGFKGLETPIAILLNLSEYNLPLDNPIMASLVYVACTRAKHMLYIMVRKNDPKRAVFQSALKAVQSTGAMVLEGSDANFEFVGTVSHYNPERIGWLEVSDPAFGKSSIMFFPHDVESAGLKDLRSGDSLRFRLHIEGQTTIAADLKRMDKNAILVEATETVAEHPVVEQTVLVEEVDQAEAENEIGIAETSAPEPISRVEQERAAGEILEKPGKNRRKRRPPRKKNSKPEESVSKPPMDTGNEVALPAEKSALKPAVNERGDDNSVTKQSSSTKKATGKKPRKGRSS